jgi:aspartyl-tRNA(Asn)/glutamyl-tRNA(Gln) amidotransferase subunit A
MTAFDRLATASAAEVGRLLLAGTVDPLEVAQFFLDRIRAAAGDHIFIALTEDRARREAEASRRRYRTGMALGPLDGVPLAWKDLFDLAGTTTTGGSALYRDAPPASQDAAVVANLAAAGMVALGKVNLSEFAYSGLGLNPHFGTPRNPHDSSKPRVPGGSSSGSAVAVARGLAPCSIGTDTGGSVRIPSAFNGLAGYKSSEGRYDKTGVFPLSPTLDTIGPLARSVEDCVLLEAALRGAVTSAVRRLPLADVSLLVPDNVVFDGIEPDVAVNFELALAALGKAGARIERRHVSEFDEMQEIGRRHGSLAAAEAYVVHRAAIDGDAVGRIDPRVTVRILSGKRMNAADLLGIAEGRRRLIASFRATLGQSLLAMPTVAHVAPEIAPLDADAELFHAVNLKTLRNTMLGNLLAHCGLALPSGRDRQGLPTSVLLSAAGGDDERLLSYGLTIERVLNEARM